ncbi:TPA: fimbria/pilus outer membrane usher protein [Escherichia coli]|nr:fimbria/pilus outer membrane usher protein [Escherichia coli]
MTAIRAAFKAYRMHQVLIMPRFARLTIALGLATAVFPVDAEYYFNPRFLSNDLAESVDLSAFTKGREAPPGTYRVDIYLNDEFMTSRDITFIADDNNAELIPCLSTDLLVSLGIKKSALLDNKEHSAEKHVPDNSACTPLQDRLADASTEFDVGQQHLSLSVPQIYVGRMARGYVSPDLWEEGINAGLLNYSFNGNSINNRSNHNAGKSNYAYLNLQSGINIGSWRLRDNSTWSYNSGSSNSSDSNKWQHINTSAERDIIPLRSRLTVGDSYTDGDIFDSVNFRGLKINSTEAMLPDSQHGFAPVIHGIARGTAQVSVKQNGYDVYQTTVPPGPFTIDDINSAANGGDLQVTIKEADGSIQTLYVPYSSVPVLQRAGYTRYALAMGEYRSGNNLQSSPKFIQGSLMHGLEGNWTPYGGMQIAEDYQAFNLGIGKDLGLVDGGSSIGAGTTSVYVNLDPVIQPGQNLVVDLSQHISCWNDYGGWYDTDHINLVQGSAFAGSLQSYKGSLYWNNVTYPFPLTTNTNVLDIGDKTPMPLPLKLYITPVGAAGGVVIKAGEVIARIHMYKIATLGSGNPRNFTWNIISNNNVVMPTGGCTVDSRNVTVDLPDFPGSAEIPLGVYCSSEQKLSFYLSGATTDSSRQVFANTAPDATKASGVGVSLMRNGKILATGENVSLGTVNKSKVPLGLSATYGQTGNKVAAGTVQSVIGVTFIYE